MAVKGYGSFSYPVATLRGMISAPLKIASDCKSCSNYMLREAAQP